MAQILDFNEALSARELVTYLAAPDLDDARVQRVREGLVSSVESFVASILPSAVFSRGEARVGNIQGDPGFSLSIKTRGPKAGLWSDFGNPSEKGGDLISLYMGVRNVPFPRAIEDLSDWIGQGTRPEISYERQRLVSRAKRVERDLGAPRGEWHYTDADGRIIATVYRFEPDSGGKEFLPWDAMRGKWGNPDIRPLYNLTGIFQSPRVVFCEGEKAAQALIDIGVCATSVMGGANSPLDQTDLSPLAGKEVMLWPDADEPGKNFMLAVGQMLSQSTLSFFNLPDNVEKGWDAADAVEEGYPLDEILGNSEPITQADIRPIKATPFAWRAEVSIPPRKWLYGHHLLRKFLSLDVAAGGVGKSSLKIGEALALASNKKLYRQEIFEGPHRVWLYNLEDPVEETERRLHATAKLFKITPEDLGGRLFVDSGRDQRCVIAMTTKNETKIMAPIVEAIIAEIQERKIDVLIIDPFVSSHSVSENDNMAMDMVAKEWARIADVCNCSINLVHHIKKTNGTDATAESARGAVSLIGAARSVMVFNRMSAEEAGKVNIPSAEARFYFRVDNDKANLAPPSTASWYRMNNVDLANGDSVGVACPWEPPNLFEGVTTKSLMYVQQEVGKRDRWRENAQSTDWVGHAVGIALQLDSKDKGVAKRIAMMVAVWVQNGALEVFEEKDNKGHNRKYVVVGKWVEE